MHEYELIRSSRRTIAIQIHEGRVIVRAPMRQSRASIDEFVRANDAWIEKHLEKDRLHAAAHPEPDEEQMRMLIERAQAILPRRVEYYGRKMGLMPTALRITGARTRFGSCSSKGHICFSWRLMMYPPEAIDYVVVHELAHLRHMNHSRDFYREIERVLPDYREREKLLK